MLSARAGKEGLRFVCQLTAGGVYVFAAAAAETGVDAAPLEMLHEVLDGIFVGFGKLGLVDGIVFDDVDEVGGYLAVYLDQLFGIFGAVVEIFEEDVFEGDLVAGLLIEMVEGIDEGLDVVGLVDGHDLVALFIVGGVKREGQLEFYFVIAELMDHFRDARGRDGDAAGAHGQSVGRGDAFDGFEDVLIVQQGLAHAHEDDIGELLFVYPLALLVDEDDFVVDLGVVEIAFAFHVPCGTEFTTERATYLRGNAGSFSFIGGDEDAFDEVRVSGAETTFDGAVGGVLGGVDGESGEVEGIGETGAEVFAEIGHVLEAAGMFLPQPFPDLGYPELFFAEGSEVLL